MATYNAATYSCDNCNTAYGYGWSYSIWDCPGCGQEVCEDCFDKLAHCKECAEGVAERVLIERANENGYDLSYEDEGEEE